MSERRDAAADAGRHVTKKRFGQHFLTDRNVLARIVQAIDPARDDAIVEIGPGDGALTRPLLERVDRLTVIELDRDLVPRLEALAGDRGAGALEIVRADVLDVDLAALAGPRRLRVVGNLPYNISSPILFHCIGAIDAIRDMHFMLQKEVVDRMAAPPGNKVYGRLSVMLQLACRVESLFGVPPGAFRPPPKVDSAIVRLTPLAPELRPDADAALIARVVRAAFGQRRKTLANALSGVVPVDRIVAAGVDPRARAEQLAPAAFVALARSAASGSGSD